MQSVLCAAPWRGLHINPRGDVKTCCAGDPNMLGNLNESSIDEILTGPVLQRIRENIRQGQLDPQYCYNCIQAERYGRSERDWHNSVNRDFDVARAADNDHRPVIVDVRWNTTCNLSCNYCGENCSSRWATLKNIPFRSGVRPYVTDVCDYLAQHSDSVKEVALVGGEPLLLPENETLLEVVPKHAVVTVITNGSVDLAKNSVFQKLQAHGRVGWSISFDNIGQRFEYVRHGGVWDLLQKNLGLIKHLIDQQGHWGGIHAVYNIYNATRLVELTEFARQQGLAIQWQSLYQPQCLDPMRLGPDVAAAAQTEIRRVLDLDICTPNEKEFFVQVLAAHQAPVTTDLALDFATHIQEIETRWHPNSRGQFQQLWPELAMLCD